MIRDRDKLRAFMRATGVSSPFMRLHRGLFQAQRPYVLDPVGNRCNHSGRRFGKSRANAILLLRPAARNPGGLSFFATPTSKDSRRILWTTLHELNIEYKLGLKFNKGDLTCTAPNGYTIWLTGIRHKDEADKLRGATHGFIVGIFDECGFIASEILEYAVVHCAMPALGENQGNVYLTGTPGPRREGFYYDKCQEWETYTGDARLNEKSGFDGLAFLEKALRDNKWTWDNPTFRREYLGEWVEDLAKLIYPYNSARNLIYQGSEYPSGMTILGVDTGFNDDTAFTVSRSMPPDRLDVHILRSYKRQNMLGPDTVKEIETLRRQYSVNHVVVDGKDIAETYKRNYGSSVLGAPKGIKRPRIDVVRGWLQSGTLKVVQGQCDDLLHEWSVLMWDKKYKDHDPRTPDHSADSAIYSTIMHRGAYSRLLDAEAQKPRRGTPEYEEAEDRRHKEEAEKEAEKAEREQFERIKNRRSAGGW